MEIAKQSKYTYDSQNILTMNWAGVPNTISDFHRTPISANKREKLKQLATIFAKSVIIVLIGWLAVWLLFADNLPFIGYVHAGGFLYGILAVWAAVILTWTRDWIWAGIATLIFLALFAMASGFHIAAGSDARSAGNLRILSASLRGMDKNVAVAARNILQYEADIIALQEVTHAESFIGHIERIDGTEWNVVQEGTYVIMSKRPMSRSQSDNSEWIGANIKLAGRTLELWNLYVQDSYARPIENTAVFVKLYDNIKIEKPDIVLGNLNASPWNKGYRLTNRLMTNAHKVAGFGPGNTFPARGRKFGLFGAFARIDHIFVDPRISVENAFVGNASTNIDHHPVIADILLPD